MRRIRSKLDSKWYPLIIVSCLVFSCDSSINLEILISKKRFEVTCPDGKVFFIVKGNEFHNSLSEWFERNQAEWVESPASYVPNIELVTKDLEINILDSLIVVNTGGRQFVKSHSESFEPFC